MVEITPKLNLSDFVKVLLNLENISNKIYPDLLRLGNRSYNYLKRLIPVSNRNKPHLRDSFKVFIEKSKYSLILHIKTDVYYAVYLDADIHVPTRFPVNKKAMRFIGRTGDIIFTKKAKGFYKRGIHFISNTENWLLTHLSEEVDLTFRRYFK